MFKKIIITTALFFLSPGFAVADATVKNSADVVKQEITTFSVNNHIPAVAVQIFHDGKPFSLYLGEAKPTTQFDVSSLNDIMTGLVLAQQVDAAKVQLKTPIREFFPVILDAEGKITLRTLATNTSGWPAKANQPSEVDEIWQPSPTGMMMLTKALEIATHKNMAELYQRHIFSVLGMRDVKVSAVELKMSATDMQKFLSAAIGLPGTPESVLYPMRLTQTAFIELNDGMIGLGWQIDGNGEQKTPADNSEEVAENAVKDVPARPVFKADRKYHKTTSNTYIAVLPNKKSGVVILLSAPVDNQALTQLGQKILMELDA